LVAQKYDGPPRRGPGRPRTTGPIADVVLRMATENPTFGYPRIRDARSHPWPRRRAEHGQEGPRLLKHAVVARRQRLDARLERAELTAQRTLEELRRVAFSDIGACFDEQGNLRPIRTLPAEVRSFVSSVKVVRKNLTAGDGSQEWVHEIKLFDKRRALEILAKHVALLVDRVQVEQP